VSPPPTLAALFSTDPIDRARHSIGRSYRDVIRGIRGELGATVDAVVRPTSEADVVAALDWANDAGVAVIPFGGGTSVVGGVEPTRCEDYDGTISLDMSNLDRVLEVDDVSRAARVQAGVLGPALEDQLRPSGLTLRFFPQSFERSSVGGWLATRAAGHYATRWTHIDDVTESIRAVTPIGVWESRRLPGSGAGPSPDRMLLGSEGTLGVITEAWLRLQPRPVHRARATVAFATFAEACAAVRAIVQSGLDPAACRAIDGDEARITGTHPDGAAVVVLGFESAHSPVDELLARAVECCADFGGAVVDGSAAAGGAGDAWRSTFVRAPYLREWLVLLGVLTETFETAMTWDRLPAYVEGVRAATLDAVRRVCGAGLVTCRLTHAYADGAAPYFTVLAPARRGSELDQWAEIKAAASEAILAADGTITHHHAVGRDHVPWYSRQQPEPFRRALQEFKNEVDGSGILNPGVLGLRV
jgi:alkyldihydroxyacetonephosphate synthase